MTKVNRRSFITSTTAVSGVAATAAGTTRAASLLTKGRGVSANDKMAIGVIGCGGRGRSLLKEFLQVDEVECLALADVDTKHSGEVAQIVSEQRRHAPDTYQDFRHLLEQDDLDVVIVATPDHWHALPTIMACQAGKDVYCEKPLATSIEEGRAMVDAARKYDRVVQVGTQQRSSPHYREAVEFVRSGQLGTIRSVRAWAFLDWKGALGNPEDTDPPASVDYDFWLGPAALRPFNPIRFHYYFRWFWDYSGGLMTDWGAHMVDIGIWAMGEDPVGAMAVGGKYGYPDDIMETPDTQTSVVKFPSFSLIWEHQVGCGIGPWEREHGVEFHGNNGTLVVDRAGWEVHSETDSMGKSREYRMQGIPRRKGSSGYDLDHVVNFLDCVRSREKPVADVETNHRSVNACHLANIALRLDACVSWDPAEEKIGGDKRAESLVGRKYRQPWKLPRV